MIFGSGEFGEYHIFVLRSLSLDGRDIYLERKEEDRLGDWNRIEEDSDEEEECR